jgi:hypothetical protein
MVDQTPGVTDDALPIWRWTDDGWPVGCRKRMFLSDPGNGQRQPGGFGQGQTFSGKTWGS